MQKSENSMPRSDECSDAGPGKAKRFFAKWKRGVALICLIALIITISFAQQARKPISSPAPEFPDIAKKMKLTGVVKIEVLIGADGEIKASNVVGGHPILADAAQKALKKWKYAPGNSETKALLEFKF
jgi:TonB family protein